ncbi:MAG TPA: EutN/CcmL family microcompartment protein [Candidatus Limnocylindrales bacterium]|nr:EutN/CcmL family microcompartment protein [Candidatus Limnocylindrales bacterium]
MYLGRVVGRIWCTVKHPHLEGQRLLMVQPLTPELENTGKRVVCLDCAGAGAGELVYCVKGKEASFPFLPLEPPADTCIVGIVDSVHVKAASKPAEAPPAVPVPVAGVPTGGRKRQKA